MACITSNNKTILNNKKCCKLTNKFKINNNNIKKTLHFM